MNLFALKGIDQDRRQQLDAANVRYRVLDKKDLSIIVEENQLPAALTAIGAEAAETPGSSQYEGLVTLDLRFNAPAPAPGVAAPRTIATTAEVNAAATTGGAAAGEGDSGRAGYIAACSKRIEGKTEVARVAFQQFVEQKLRPLSAQLFQTWRQELAATNTDRQEFESKFAAEFEQVFRSQHVRDVRVSNGCLLISTDKIFAVHPKTKARHEIGEFTIVVDLKGRLGGVRWFNLSRRVDTLMPGMNAPYVYADGTACVDEMAASLLELVARGELSVVADLAVQFLENVYADPLGEQLNQWPSA